MRAKFAARMFGLALSIIIGCPQYASAQADAYPNKNIWLIVPYPGGGLVDAVARLLQPSLEKALGRAILIDNRPAASGTIATRAVSKADPDGYTLLLASSTHTVAPATDPKIPYNIERDFAPIALVAKVPSVLLTNAKVPAKTLAELISLAKAERNKLSYATPGAASHGHLLTLVLSRLAGIEMVHVPYRGGAPALMGIVGGDVQFGILSAQIAYPMIESGKLRALATGGRERDKQLPGVPTVMESGFPGFEGSQWVGLLAPAQTPASIVERLNAELNRIVRDPDMIAKFVAQGMLPAGGTPEEFSKLISLELKQWTEVARQAKVTAE